MKYVVYVGLTLLITIASTPLFIWFLIESSWNWDFKKGGDKCNKYIENLIELVFNL
jgi:hypothetical protein